MEQNSDKQNIACFGCVYLMGNVTFNGGGIYACEKQLPKLFKSSSELPETCIEKRID